MGRCVSASGVPVACCVVLLVVGYAAPLLASDFSDVPKWYWAWPYVVGVSDGGIASGYPDGSYQPGLVVTRDQMAVYVARGLAGGEDGVPSGPAIPNFRDVDGDYWAYDHIEYCFAQGVVAGFDDATYRPDLPVNRGAMAAYMARAIKGGEASVPLGSGTQSFSDVPTDHWAYKYIDCCVAEQVVSGFPDGSYRPDLEVTRDQMAVYVCRAFELATPSQPYNITDYFPLGVGDTWTYLRDGDLYQVAVTGTTQLGDRVYADLTYQDEGETNFWVAAEDGLRMGGVSGPSGPVYSLDPPAYLPNGLDPGDTGSTTSDVYEDGSLVGQSTLTYTFVGLESVSVPAGDFPDCLKVQIQTSGSGTDEFYLWLARGVGVVKQDARPFGGTAHMELVAATVGGQRYPAAEFALTDCFPLAQGNTWTYQYNLGGTWTSEVSGMVNIGGREYARVVSDGGEHAEYWAVDSGGVYLGGFLEPDAEITFSPPLTIPAALEVGQQYQMTTTAYQDGSRLGSGTFRCVFVAIEPVIVPAGLFPTTAKLELEAAFPGGMGDHWHSWYAPGVGELICDKTALGGEDRDELVSARVNGVEYP